MIGADDGQTVITVLTVRQLHAKLPIKDVGGPAARSGPGQRDHWACAGAGAAEGSSGCTNAKLLAFYERLGFERGRAVGISIVH
jgi:hypothetical protein